MREIDTVSVALGARGYDIHIGSGVLDRAGALIAPLARRRRLIVVSDANVARLHLARLTEVLTAAGLTSEAIILPAGEASKSFAQFERLCEDILARGIERGDMLVAFGGGVIGDLVGFAAAVLLRGIDFIQIPTTLLAQVDSSVGGKTGINTRQGKNLVGAFHQPRLVLADTAVLDTLPARELRAGYAEVVKYGLIGDAAFFAWLETHGPALLAGDGPARQQAVRTSCEAKARLVAADEREAGARALLNLGHTFGHALEAEMGYGPALLHGEAVAIGMVMAYDLSVRLGMCPAADAARLRAHLDAVGLATAPGQAVSHDWAGAPLLAHMGHDKKVRDGRIVFVLSRGIGAAVLHDQVPAAVLTETLRQAVSA